MYRPSLNEAKEIAADYKMIPVSREIYSDIRTPIEVLKILKNVSSHCFLLESMESAEQWGRYTFLGFDPKLELTCTNGAVNINSGLNITETTQNPREANQQILDENKSPGLITCPLSPAVL